MTTDQPTPSIATAAVPAAATLSCQCQQVQLAFPCHPVSYLECCCCDCRRAVKWCTEQAQQKQHTSSQPATRSRLLAVPLVYFPNRVRIVHGASCLQLYTLRPGYNTRRWIATCCWTPMIGDHPAYQRRRIVSYVASAVMVPPSSENNHHRLSQLTLWRTTPTHTVSCDGPQTGTSPSSLPTTSTTTRLVLPPPTHRIFTDDLTPQERNSIPPLSPSHNDNDNGNHHACSCNILQLPPVSVATTIVTDETLQAMEDTFPPDQYVSFQTLLVRQHDGSPLYYMENNEQQGTTTHNHKIPHWNRSNPDLPPHE
jgi:hypothetical protein